MNIIFGSDLVEEIANSYTVLELDTIRMLPAGTESTAWCVVEKIPLSELGQLDELKKLHHDMMTQYKTGDWVTCEKSVKMLLNCWGTEVDSFYEIMLKRVQDLQVNYPGPDWDPVIEKTDS
jgi:hypothetical protein